MNPDQPLWKQYLNSFQSWKLISEAAMNPSELSCGLKILTRSFVCFLKKSSTTSNYVFLNLTESFRILLNISKRSIIICLNVFWMSLGISTAWRISKSFRFRRSIELVWFFPNLSEESFRVFLCWNFGILENISETFSSKSF